jgi:hypothetical protein
VVDLATGSWGQQRTTGLSPGVRELQTLSTQGRSERAQRSCSGEALEACTVGGGDDDAGEPSPVEVRRGEEAREVSAEDVLEDAGAGAVRGQR